ncbi:MAG: GNAT family N-acetyltransferase [Tepidisphaerales bacterium]
MRPAESTATSRVIRRVILGCYASHPKAKLGESAKYTPARLRQRVKRDRDAVFVALCDRRIVGFCVNFKDDGVLMLEWYGVDPARRRHGLGQRLLQHLINGARRRGCHKVWCDTNADNRASAKVLSRAGFEPVCTLENHWYGQDFILWQKLIPMMRVVHDEEEIRATARPTLRLVRMFAPRERGLVAAAR